jgi:hypothetical protein
MQLGDSVTWKSQANGHWKEKTGTIHEVVPLRHPPNTFIKDGHGSSRDHESYVICVKRPRSVKYYWPVVSGLQLVNPVEKDQ